jgi:hypothetical protein
MDFAARRCVEASTRLASMAKHLAEPDTIAAEGAAKEAWCGAQATRGQIVAANEADCDASVADLKAAA